MLALADEIFLIGIPFLIVTTVQGDWIFGMPMCKIYLTTTSINQVKYFLYKYNESFKLLNWQYFSVYKLYFLDCFVCWPLHCCLSSHISTKIQVRQIFLSWSITIFCYKCGCKKIITSGIHWKWDLCLNDHESCTSY